MIDKAAGRLERRRRALQKRARNWRKTTIKSRGEESHHIDEEGERTCSHTRWRT